MIREQEPLTVAELGRRLGLEPATLSPLLKRLEATGLITRRRDPDEERAWAVRLTPSGAALRARATRVPPATLVRLGLEVRELEELRDGLTRLIAAAPQSRSQRIGHDSSVLRVGPQ